MSMAAVAYANGPASGAASGPVRALLGLHVNHVDKGVALVYVLPTDLLMRLADLRRVGVHGVGGAQRTIDGQKYVSLKSLAPAITYRFDRNNLTLALDVKPIRFGVTTRTDLAFRPPADIAYPSTPSAFLNYAVSGTDTQNPTVTAEQGVTWENKFLDNNMTVLPSGRFVRGLSSLTISDRKKMRQWTIGDAFASSNTLGGGAFLGGVTYSSDFNLDPYFMPSPTQAYTGVVTVPSTASVYVNGRLVREIQLAPGQYNLTNIPRSAGSGVTQIVIRNAFGQTQQISQPYYLSAQTLAKGLQKFTFSAGMTRGAIGSASGHYAHLAALAYDLYGISNSVSAGGFVQGDDKLLVGGPEIDVSLPFGAIGVSAAASRGRGMDGWSSSVSYNYSTRGFGVGGDAIFTSKRFTTLSLAPFTDRAITRFDGFATYQLFRRVSLNLNYSEDQFRDSGQQHQISAIASMPLGYGRNISLSLSRTSSQGQKVDYSALVSFMIPFGPETIGTVSADYDRRSGTTETASVQKSLPPGPGLGYLLQMQTGQGGQPQTGGAPATQGTGQLTYQSAHGLYQFSYVASAAQKTATYNASGGLVLIGGRLLATPPVQGSYALIRVPGLAGVTGYLSNHAVGKTDRDGDLFVTNLQSGYANDISINDENVSMKYSLSAPDQVIAPPPHGGAMVVFPVTRLQAFLGVVGIKAMDKNGKRGVEIPAYGTLRVTAGGKQYSSPIGSFGQFYLTNLPPGSHSAVILYENRRCEFNISIPKSDQTFVRIGKQLCTPK